VKTGFFVLDSVAIRTVPGRDGTLRISCLSEASLKSCSVPDRKHCSGDKKAFWLLWGFGQSDPPEADCHENRRCFSAEITSGK